MKGPFSYIGASWPRKPYVGFRPGFFFVGLAIGGITNRLGRVGADVN
jgi:hypothetical protein